MLRVPYLREEDAPRLRLNYLENAGIDLFPSLKDWKVISDEVDAKIEVSDERISVLVLNTPFVLSVKTPYRFALPKGVHGIVFGRSGNFFKQGIDVFKGVIDSSYRGPISVGLIFNKRGIFHIQKNIAIAQLVLFTNELPALEEVDADEFAKYESERGEKGFGSSGFINGEEAGR